MTLLAADRTAPDQLSPEGVRARDIIIEIIRCAGGRVEGKSRISTIFYLAHLIYAKNAVDYLSEWRIVRTPLGPGIASVDHLLDVLRKSGAIEIRGRAVGPYTTAEYRLTTADAPDLSLDAIDAIRRAVDFAGGMTAADLSDLTRQHSHCWRDAGDGDELNIYVDLLSEDQYAQLKSRTASHLDVLREITA